MSERSCGAALGSTRAMGGGPGPRLSPSAASRVCVPAWRRTGLLSPHIKSPWALEQAPHS